MLGETGREQGAQGAVGGVALWCKHGGAQAGKRTLRLPRPAHETLPHPVCVGQEATRNGLDVDGSVGATARTKAGIGSGSGGHSDARGDAAHLVRGHEF